MSVNGENNNPVLIPAGSGFTACTNVGDVQAGCLDVHRAYKHISRKRSPTRREQAALKSLRRLLKAGRTKVTVFQIGLRIEGTPRGHQLAQDENKIYKIVVKNGYGWEKPLQLALPKSMLSGLYPHPNPPVLGTQSKMGVADSSLPFPCNRRPRRNSKGSTLLLWPQMRRT